MKLHIGQIFRRGRITRIVKDTGEHASFITCLEIHQDGYQRIVRPMWFQWRMWSATAREIPLNRAETGIGSIVLEGVAT